MKDKDKSKSQLIEELLKLRARVAELEKNDAVRESEERLHMILEATKDGIWEWKTKTGEADFSPSYYTMLGYEPGEFPSSYNSWRQLLHPDDLEATEAAIQCATKERTSFSVEFRMKAKNGSWNWILSRGKAVELDTEGKIVRMVGTHKDISEQKQIEESLRMARSIIDSANIGIYLIGSDSRIKEVNQKAADLLGYTKEDLEALSIPDIDPLVTGEIWEILWKNLNTHNVQDFTFREHRKKDGSAIPIEIYSNILKYGGHIYSVAFVRDITQRKQNEEILREKDQLLYDIGRLVKIGAWGFNIETGISRWTDEVFRIYDLKPAENVPPDIGLDFYYDDSRERLNQAFNAAVKYGTPYDLELEMVSAQGIHKWVRTICNPVMKGGRVIQMQGSIQDITEIKYAEILLKESESKYRALINFAPLGIGIVNTEGSIVEGNQALGSMLGYEKDELLDLSLQDISHPDALPHENILLKALLNDEKTTYSLEKQFRHKNGNYFWVNVSVSKIENIFGPGVFYFGFVENINNRKQMEKEREELIRDLKKALAEIQELRGFIPICANCKRVRDDEGYWEQVEQYITDRTAAQFSHSLCPDCAKELYPDIYKRIKDENK